MADRLIKYRFVGDVGGLTSATRRAGNDVRGLGTQLQAAGHHTDGLGTRMRRMATGTAGLVAAFGIGKVIKDSVQLEAAFSSTMNQIKVATKAPASELRQLDALAMKLGQDTVFSANEAADAMLQLAKGGLSPAQIQAGALKNTLTLATAGGLQLGDAANSVVRTMGAFELKARDTGAAVAALAGAANASSADVSDITQALQQAGTSAHAAGLSVQETTAVLALFADKGIKGSDAGTSLRTMLTRLVPQTAKASKEMKALGLSFTFEDGSFKSIADVAQQLHDKLGPLSAAQRTQALQTLFGSDAQRAANVLLNSGARGLAKYMRSTTDLTQAQKLARANMAGTKGALEQLSGAVDTAELQIGRTLAPTVRHLAGFLTKDALPAVTDFFKGMQSGQGIGGAVARDLDQIWKAGGKVVGVIGDVAQAFDSLPSFAKQTIAIGAIGGFAAKKAGVFSGIGKLNQIGGRGLGGGGVTPVFVTNPGFVGSGKAGPGGMVVGGKPGRGGFLRGGGLGLGTIAALTVGSLFIGGKSQSPGAAAGKGAATGAAIGSLGGLPGAAAGAGVGALIGLDSFKSPTEKAFLDSMSKRNKSVKELVKAYQLLAGKQKDLSSADSSFVSPAALINGDKMKTVLRQIGKETGLTGRALKDFAATGVDPAAKKLSATSANLDGLVFNAHKAGVSTQQLGQMMKTLPSQVVTKILSPGAVQTKKDMRQLGRQYGLTPKQIQTLIKLNGFQNANHQVDKHKKNLKDLDHTSARPKVEPNDPGFDPRIDKHKKKVRDLDHASAKPKIDINDQASGKIGQIQGAINGMHGTTVTIATKHVNTVVNRRVNASAAKSIEFHPAEGGHIRGPGTESSDSIPAMLSDNEYVVRASAVRKYGVGMLNRINTMNFAGGGLVQFEDGSWGKPYQNGAGHRAPARNNAGGREEAAAQKHHVNSIKAVSRELRRLVEHLKNVRQARKDYAKTVSQAFVTDPFGGTLGGFDSQVKYESNRLRGARTDLHTLRSRGLSGALYKDLAVSGNATLIDQFSHLSRSQLAARERNYRARNREDTGIGNQAAAGAFSARTQELTAEIRALRRELHRKKIGHTTNIHRATIQDSPTKKNSKKAAQKARHG